MQCTTQKQKNRNVRNEISEELQEKRLLRWRLRIRRGSYKILRTGESMTTGRCMVLEDWDGSEDNCMMNGTEMQ